MQFVLFLQGKAFSEEDDFGMPHLTTFGAGSAGAQFEELPSGTTTDRSAVDQAGPTGETDATHCPAHTTNLHSHTSQPEIALEAAPSNRAASAGCPNALAVPDTPDLSRGPRAGKDQRPDSGPNGGATSVTRLRFDQPRSRPGTGKSTVSMATTKRAKAPRNIVVAAGNDTHILTLVQVPFTS